MKTFKKVILCICVFALILCLFAIPAFAENQFYPLPDIGEYGYPQVLPDTNYIRFAFPFEYGLIPVTSPDGYSTYDDSVGFFIEAEYYIRVVLSAWTNNGELFNDYSIDNVYIDNVIYDPSYYTDSVDPVSGLRTFEIDLERIGKLYQEIKIDIDIEFTTSAVPAFVSFGASPNDYITDRTIDYIMCSSGYYLKTSQAFYSIGETDGYINGLNSIDDISDSVLGIVSSPFQAIGTALNFELFGINLAKTFFFLLAVVVVAFIIRSVKND